MNYSQAIDYMYSQLPMFHRIGAPAYKANLDNTLTLSELTGHPHEHFKSIHIAGTNGKGSVSHMLASIFQTAGYKTGLFTSPHLVDFRERIKVNGVMIDESYVANFISDNQEDFESIKPSFFEMTFALAMCWFRDSNIEVGIIETGMGGRLDSTNIITPVVSVITNIGLDHTQFLGNTLEAIASEKAGIIKNNVPVVVGEEDPETAKVFVTKATNCNSSISFASKEITIIKKEDGNNFFKVSTTGLYTTELISPLTGDYQLKNIATVLTAINSINKTGAFKNLTEETIASGIEQTVINTGLEGRWQVIGKDPLIICDIAHNPHGIKLITQQIKRQKFDKLHFVIGTVNDKDVSTMLSMLPHTATYYFCKADIPRGLNANELMEMAKQSGLTGECYESVAMAYHNAVTKANINDMVFVGGSAFVVAEVLAAINHR